MIDSITAARTRAASALAACMLSLGALAQPAPRPASGPPALPPLPHQAQPEAVPYPDYYTLARARTTLADDPRFRTLRLRAHGRQTDPGFIVLPVQTQAFGFLPVFRALVGASLDQELARRHVDASVQTDIVDWRGPFVRRLDDATVSAFAGEHGQSTLLTLYLGHDGNGSAFVSLSRSTRGQVRVAHRRVQMVKTETGTLATIRATLPGLLAELGLGDANPAHGLARAHADRCMLAHWALADLPPTAAPDDVACHAILMGTLMPDYFSPLGGQVESSAPDRLAWLARAWVEATPLASGSPAMKAIAALAAGQLHIDERGAVVPADIESRDVVAGPLARVLRAQRQRSNGESDPVPAGLPPFAKAVLQARTAYATPFHPTDLCPLELALPHFRIPPRCDDDAGPSTPMHKAPASLSESQLLETWRLAAHWSDLYIEGVMRGSQRDFAAVLADLPPDIAAHPFIREVRFAARGASGAPRDVAGHRAWAEAAIRDYAQAIVTLQRDDLLIVDHKAADAAVSNERSDAVIASMLDGLDRVASVVDLDSPGSSEAPPPGAARLAAAFLVNGSFAQAKPLQVWKPGVGPVVLWTPPPAPASAPAARHGAIPEIPYVAPITQGTFSMNTEQRLPSRQALESWLAARPAEITYRMLLALVALEHGQGVTKARQILDARPRSTRAPDALGETEDLYEAASVFYFTGHLEIAREYYVRAAAFNTGSAADMGARARIAAIDGDFATARREFQRRAQRYDDDFAVSQEAGYLFMAGRPADAWPLILGRALTSKRPDFWRVALSGHRVEGDALLTLPAWLRQTGLERRSDADSGIGGNSWINTYATLDRLPVVPDAGTLKAMANYDPRQTWANGILTRRAAIVGSSPAEAQALEQDATVYWFGNQHLLPFYAWALWNTSGGKAAPLDFVRTAPLESGFGGTLSKAMVLAADGRRDESLRFLTAARYELGRLALFGTPQALRDPLRTAPYDFVLATWLMSRQTGEPAYAAQGLAIARGYQHFEAWVAWPYAAEALLGKDPAAREIAACRAQKLDADSMFLHESGLHPDPKSAACRKATAW